jgi:hypothetical protein
MYTTDYFRAMAAVGMENLGKTIVLMVKKIHRYFMVRNFPLRLEGIPCLNLAECQSHKCNLSPSIH